MAHVVVRPREGEITVMLSTAKLPSESTLARTPTRVLNFLLGVGGSSVIRGLLERRGYATAEHERGWTLLRAADPLLAATVGDAPTPTSETDVRAALAKLDAWDNDNLPIADVALRRREPEAHALLFAGDLTPAEGVESVAVVEKFLTRLDALTSIAASAATEAKPARAKKTADAVPEAASDVTPTVTREQAASALSILATRGINDDERKAARSWLVAVKRGATPAKPPSAEEAARAETANRDALVALYEWHNEWVLILKKATTRRSHLIAVGAAERKSPAKKPSAPTPPTK